LSLVTPRKGYKSVESNYKKKIEIPKDWTFEQIGSKINILSGFPFDSKNFDKEIGLPLIRIRDLANIDTKIRYNGNFLKEFTINSGDLLVGMDGEFRPYLWKGNLSLLNQRVCKITTSNEDILNQNFIFYSIKKGLFHYELINIGTTVIHISKTNIEKIKIPLPSLPEQQKIATILSNVDNLIESTEKVITHSKKVKTGLMQKLLTRGIGHVTFKKVPWLFGKEIEIPEEWEVCKIRNLVENKTILEIQDGNHGELHPKSIDFVNQGIPFVTADCIINNNVDYKKCKLLPSGFLKTLRIGFSKKGDVILTHKGSIGFTAIVNDEFETIILSPQTTYYRLSDKLIPKFLYYIFQTHNFQKQLQAFGKQSTRDYVGITAQQHLIIPFIQDVIEQQKIATILSNIDSKITSQEQYKEKLEKLKKSLMQKLLTGEVRV